MAGAGYKLFNTGDVLTAAQVNTYLMEQTVMVFDDAAARTTALTGVVSEGMISYLKDTNAVEVYNGSAWVASDDPNAIQNSIINAKGDIIVGSANDTPAILSAPTEQGSTLVADSASSVGLRYQANFAAGKNKIINGAFDIWQRGTSFTQSPSVETFSADRWFYNSNGSGGTITLSQQTFTAGAAPVAGYEGQFFFRYTCTSARTSQTFNVFGTRLEDVRTFAGQTVTISYWGKASTNVTLADPYFAQFFGSGGSSTVNTTFSSVNLTTSWQRFTSTITLPSISGKTIGTNNSLQIIFQGLPNTTGVSIDFWGFQLEAGSVATAFQTATGTLQGEIALAQRYYYRWVTGGTSTAWIQNVFNYSTTIALGTIKLPVTMRVNPTSIDVTATAADYRLLTGSTVSTCSAVPVLDTSNADSPVIKYTVASGLTLGQGGIAGANSTNNAYIGFNAEL
jgi:hypothetical protein